MNPCTLPNWLRFGLVIFFAIVGLMHGIITEFYFPQMPAWDTYYIVAPLRASGPLSLVGAFFLTIPRRSCQLVATWELLLLTVWTLPAHVYAAATKLILGGVRISPMLNWIYVALMIPVTAVLIWNAVALVRGRQRRS